MPDPIDQEFDAPYRLDKKFSRIILPIALLLSLLLIFTAANGSKWLIEQIYISISTSRVDMIHRALERSDYDAWKQLQASLHPQAVFKTPKGKKLLDQLRSEVEELGLSHLRIYNQNALILFASNENKIGQYDKSNGFTLALQGKGSITEKTLPTNEILYEIYARVPDATETIVMELYEPISYLDQLVSQFVIPVVITLVSFLLLLMLLTSRLVKQAQSDINLKSELLLSFRKKLQKLVSNEAVSTLKQASKQQTITVSKRIRATILFSDIRGFTSYSEDKSPEEIVNFLNQSLSVVIKAINYHQGDVDKMIGDAVLAFFQGEDSEQNALDAANRAIIENQSHNLPRGIGIGIYTGEVVIGTVGAENRMDFTLIGDTVNTASRLCSAADEHQIVIDSKSYQKLFPQEPYTVELISAKGKSSEIEVVRINI